MDMYKSFQWDDSSDALTIDKVSKKFEERYLPARNETYNSYVFLQKRATG